MADFPGLTFSPTGDQTKNPNGSPSNGPQGYAPIQDAIRTLRFSIPRFGGASSPIPPGLMNGAGSGGLDLQGILASLFGNQPQPGGGVPDPNVTPGATGPKRPYGFGGSPNGDNPYAPPGAPRPSTPRGPDFPFPGGGRPDMNQGAPSAPMGGAMTPQGGARDWMGRQG